MIEVHLMKLRARDVISADEERAMRGLVSEVTDVGADRTFIRHGGELAQSTLLLKGWMARAKDLPNGQRQLAEIHVPGDFVDLHSFTLKRLDHKELTERLPHLARVYWFMTNMDAAIHREWTLSLGCRSALSRMAHLFSELNVRLGLVGLAHNEIYDFPLTQIELGECLGLTSVHVNRTLQELRRMGLIELENRVLRILDLQGLHGIAEFDPAYLYLDKRPR